jgi:hypothetical protein
VAVGQQDRCRAFTFGELVVDHGHSVPAPGRDGIGTDPQSGSANSRIPPGLRGGRLEA